MTHISLVVLGAAAVGGAMVAVAAIYRRPQRGLLILAAFTPLHGLLEIAPVGGWVGYWKEALVGLTALFAWLRRSRRSDMEPPPLRAPWWQAAAVLVVFGTLSALAVYGVIGLVAVKITFFYMLVVVAVLYLAPFDARDRDNLVSVIMVMGALTSLVGIAQQILGPGVMVELGYQYGVQVRTTGGFFRTFSTFNQPFPFALYVMLAILVGGAVALSEPHRPRNLVFLCLSPVMAIAMTTSVVRGSILGLMVGLIWLVLIRFRAGVLPLLVGAGVVAVCSSFLPRGVLGAFLASSSVNERSYFWAQNLESVFTHPLGRGLGFTGATADRIASASGTKLSRYTTNYNPDNYYMKILLELGPIGVWALIALLVTALLWAVRLSRSLPGRDGAFALGVSASIAAAMAASIVATYFEIFPLDIYFWLLLGVVGCAAAQHESELARKPSKPEAEWTRLSTGP